MFEALKKKGGETEPEKETDERKSEVVPVPYWEHWRHRFFIYQGYIPLGRRVASFKAMQGAEIKPHERLVDTLYTL